MPDSGAEEAHGSGSPQMSLAAFSKPNPLFCVKDLTPRLSIRCSWPLKDLKVEPLHDPKIPLYRVHPEGWKSGDYNGVVCIDDSVIHSRPRVKAAHESIGGWVGKQTECI